MIRAVDADPSKPPAQREQEVTDAVPRGSMSCSWTLWVMLLPLVYLLSVGPMAALEQNLQLQKKHPQADRVLVCIYAPLGWVVDRVPSAEKWFLWYARLFGVKTDS